MMGLHCVVAYSKPGTRSSLSARICHRRQMTVVVQSLRDIPQPPKDAKSYEPPEDTHVGYFAQCGGPTRIADFARELYKIDDVVAYRFPGSPLTVTMFDPEEMLKVHKAAGPTPLGSTTSMWSFMEFFSKHQTKYRGTPMAFTTDPAYWKDQRHNLQKGLFGHEDAHSLVPLFAGAVKDAVRMLPANATNILPFINRMTFEVMHSIIFGKRALALDESTATPEDQAFISSVLRSMTLGGALLYNPAASIIPKLGQLPKEYAARVPKEVMDAWEAFIQTQKDMLDIGAQKVERAMVEVSSGSDSLVRRYMRDSNLNRDELLLNVAGLLQGGVDTTANTVLWCYTRLAQYPEAQRRVRQEVRAIERSSADPWTAEHLSKLKLLSSFIDETMRFMPTAVGHRRTTVEDCDITSRRTGKKYSIPAGTTVLFLSREMRNDSRHVPDAGTFQVDRFTRECKHARRGTLNAKVDHPIGDVFSFGPRMCLGGRLAKIELMNILAETLDTYDDVRFSTPGFKFEVTNAFLTRPDPIPKFELVPRL